MHDLNWAANSGHDQRADCGDPEKSDAPGRGFPVRRNVGHREERRVGIFKQACLLINIQYRSDPAGASRVRSHHQNHGQLRCFSAVRRSPGAAYRLRSTECQEPPRP